MKGTAPRSHRHDLPALDGIRAIAVVAVMLYHFGVSGAKGGFLGVDVFFVLSGYLITGQLMTRWVLGERISLRRFWTARARRLLPGLAALLVGTTTAVVVLDRSQLSLFRGDVLAAATYSSNWWYIGHQRSYFVAAGRPPLLQHLWSLAVEEQFYVIWPLVIAAVVLLVRSAGNRRRVLLALALAIAAASSLVMGIGSAWSHAPEAGDPSRWYFGSDSHVMGLLLGAALAIWRHGDQLGARVTVPRPRASRAGTVVGCASLAVLLLTLSRTDEFSPWLYRWGFVAVSLLTVAVIAVSTRVGVLESLLSRPVLRGLGRRSYALYLWHWPIACFTRPGVDLPVSQTGALLLRFGLTLLLAELSYQWVEQPVRREGLPSVWRTVRSHRIGAFRATTVLTGFVAALAVGVVMPATASPTEPTYASGGTVYVADPGHPGHVRIAPPRSTASPPSRPSDTGRTTGAPPASHPHGPSGPSHATHTHPTTPPSPPTSVTQLRRFRLAVYGDSVPLGAIPDLAGVFGSVANHATEGIQSWTLLPQLARDASAGRLDGEIVLIHTGDNGIIERSQLETALHDLAHATRVILAMPYVPREWESYNEAVIRAVAGDYHNVTVMDWDTLSRDHPEYTWSDAIHLTPSGERAYTGLVTQAALGR